MGNNYLWLIFLFNVLQAINGKLTAIPSYMRVCHRSDPNLSNCVRQSVEELRPKLREGLPELNLPSLDPLYIPKLTMNNIEGALSLNSEFRNITVRGPSNFEIARVDVDPEKLRIQLDLKFPRLDLEARYFLNGRILILPIQGSGPCTGNYSNITANAVMQAEKVKINGEDYLKVKDIKIDFDIGGAKIDLKELFGGDAKMGEAMNHYLNENWRSVASEFRPALQKAITGLVRGVAERVFSAFPYDMLLPK